jgi:hypothetical protein
MTFAEFRKRYNALDDQDRYELLELLDLERIYDGDGHDMTPEVLAWAEKLLAALEHAWEHCRKPGEHHPTCDCLDYYEEGDPT